MKDRRRLDVVVDRKLAHEPEKVPVPLHGGKNLAEARGIDSGVEERHRPLENVGGEINAATSVESTSYTARVLGENVDVALDVIGDILTSSTFAAAELAREKGVILQEYAAVEDTPDDLVYDAFMERAFTGQAIGRPILGTPTTVKGFDAAAIHRFMEREYVPGKMVLAAAGNVDHESIVAGAKRAFGHLPARPATLDR